MIKQLALTSKTLLISFGTVVGKIIKIVHFIKGLTMNSLVFSRSRVLKGNRLIYASFSYTIQQLSRGCIIK